MFCSKCGKEIPDNSDFCKFCGANLKGDTKDNSKKEEKKPSSLDSKKKKIIAIIAAVVVAIAIVVVVVICCTNAANAEKEKAYNEGVAYIASNSLGDAQDSFEKAGDYKDAEIYLASVSAANKLYNQNAPGEALTIMSDMVNTGDNRDTITKYADRDSSQLACFMAGEVYYSNKNYSDADSYYTYLPITYKKFSHSVYERRAFIAFLGNWNIHWRGDVTDTSGTHSCEIDEVYTVSDDGILSVPAMPIISATDGSSWRFGPNDAYTSKWLVDTSFDGSDGVYHYYFDGNKDDKATVTSGELSYKCDHSTANWTEYWTGHKA